MKPDIIKKDKSELIEDINKFKLEIEYYRGKCAAYEFMIMNLAKLVEKE